MSDRSLIAVVIPAYNLARYLPEAVESVLAQTVPPDQLEVLVIDDGSTDATAAVASRFAPRVRYIRQTNRGLPATRNRGIRETTAPYVAFLDADDRLLPTKLADEVAVLESEPTIDIAYSGWYYIDERGERLPQHGWSRDEGDLLPRLLLGNVIHPHAALVRRSILEASGGFDETLTSVEDWDLWIRLSAAGARWRLVDHAALEYRVRRDGMHTNPGRMLSNRLRVLEKALATLSDRPEMTPVWPIARRNAYLEAACDWARSGDHVRASHAMAAAVRETSAFLTTPRGLREICRLLLPLGYRNESAIRSRWLEIEPPLRALVTSVTGACPPMVRLRVRVARARLALRYRRKRWRRPYQRAAS